MNKIIFFSNSKFFKFNTLTQLITIGICLFTFSTAVAQNLQAQQFQNQLGNTDPGCGTDELMHKMYKENPELREKIRKKREDIQKQELKQRQKSAKSFKDGACDPSYYRTIPMVFHVFHQGGDEKINKTQIDASIQDLVNDFNSSNADRLQPGDPFYEDQACVRINFNLATQDPEGNATNGVTYTESIYTNGGDSFDSPMKSLIHWPEENYLNVYVVKYMADKSAWAFYPEQTEYQGSGDGVTIRYNYVGTTEEASPSSAINNDPRFYPNGYHNRTHILSHEVGHWLGLQHAWGDVGENGTAFTNAGQNNCAYDDGVDDTPNCKGTSAIVSPQNATCANLTSSSCANAGYNGDYNNTSCGSNMVNIFNMMDYGAEIMFTEGQKTRMRSYLDPDNGPKIAGRHIIGTTGAAYLPSGVTSLVMDGYYFQESSEDNGAISNSIIVELSHGSFNFNANGYINPNWVTTTNLPAGLALYAYEVPGATNKARLAISGNASDHDNIDDVSNIEVEFDYANAFTGAGNLHNLDLNSYTVTLKGLKVDFKEFEPVYTRFAINGVNEYACVENEDEYQGIYSIDFGWLALHKKEGKYHLLTESSINIQVASSTQNADGTNNANYYSAGTNIHQIPTGQFKSVTRANFNPGAIVLNNITSDQYIAFRINTDATSGSKILYGWFRVRMDGAKYCMIDAVYNTASSGLPLQTGENPVQCNSTAIDTEILPTNLSIGGIPISDGMTLQATNYSNYDFRGNAGHPDNHANWGIWIDVNNDGYFDYDEAYFSIYYIPVSAAMGEGVAYYDAYGDYRTLDGIDLSNIPDGQYTMRVILSVYAYRLHIAPTYFFDPCQPYTIGGTQDFTVNIGTTDPNPNPGGLDDYPWLAALDLTDCCQYGTITEYTGSDGFQYIYIQSDSDCHDGKMYNATGQFYCESLADPNYNCIDFYGLTNPVVLHICSNSVCNVEDNTLDFTTSISGFQVTVQSNFTETDYEYNWDVSQANNYTVSGTGSSVNITFDSCGEYDICLQVVNDADPSCLGNICKTVKVKPLRPSKNDITIHNGCTNKIRLKTTAYIGQWHQYRWRKRGTANWVNTTITNEQYKWLTNTLQECTKYDIQLRVRCGAGNWSAWSPIKIHTTKGLKADESSISSQVLSETHAYLYCDYQPDQGDNKQFMFKPVNTTGTNQYKTTTSHFVTLTSADVMPNVQYEYRVRRKCGNTGTWSCWSNTRYFTMSSNGGRLDSKTDLNDMDFEVFPNPFLDNFQIKYELPSETEVALEIYNINGEKVKTIFENELQSAGSQLKNVHANELANGVYFIHLNTIDNHQIIKLMKF